MPVSTRAREFIRSNIMGILALYVALGGTAFAIEVNSVRSKHIKNGEVRAVDIDKEEVQRRVAEI